MKLKKISLFVLAVSYCIIAQSQNVPITENGSVVYVTDVTKSFVIGDTTSSISKFKIKNLPLAQDSTPGNGHGNGVGLLKNFRFMLIDKEGEVFQSKEKVVAAGPPVFAGAGGACIAGNAWRETPTDVQKLFLCNKYHFLGIRTQNPAKSLHIVSFHSKGVPSPGDNIAFSHEGMRLELIYKDHDLNLTTVSKWDLEPFVDPVTFEKKFHLGMPGNPFFTINENGYVGIGETDPKTSLSITPSDLGAKITLWDDGDNANHIGFGVSNTIEDVVVPIIIRKLNYHIGDVFGSHVFYAGGKNGDGTELMRIRGNGLVTINDKLAVGTTDAQNILNLHRQGVTSVYAQFTNGHTETIGNGEGFKIGIAANGDAELRSNHRGSPIKFFTTDLSDNFSEKMRITADGNVGIGTPLTNNTNQYKLAVNGRIGAKDYWIENTSDAWPDYVYKTNYPKLSIPKLRDFIYKYGYHPNFDSAEEIAEKGGMSVVKTQINQQVTLEEYSLYFIEIDDSMT
ncbi:MAG: hypothetical protein IIA88_01420, partial [Bacteroidetes bacterium]|nr:hypothetical protein [Bacteroidota bacterium]